MNFPFQNEKKKEKKEKKLNEDEEKKIVNLVQSNYNKSYNFKAPLHKQWEENHKAYTGELFKKSTSKVNAISNMIFSTIETIKPIMLSSYPKISVMPRGEANFSKAKIIQHALDYEWKRANMFHKLMQTVHNSLEYCTGIVGIFWNGSLHNGLGDVEAKVIAPFNFFIDPMATTIQEAEYCMYATYKPLGEIIKAYPDKAEALKKQVTSNKDAYLAFGKTTSDDIGKNVLYIECYMRDYSTIQEINEEGDEESKLKYPLGRRTIIAGDVLLEDGHNPYLDGKFPFAELPCYKMPHSFWGMSEVEQIISPQKHLIDVTNSIVENAGLMANPVWLLDKNCGVAVNSLTNKRGLVVRKNPGTEIRRDAPPAIPGYVLQTVDMLKYDIQQISGVFDTVKGERTIGVSAASAIRALNEQAEGRIKLKVQNLEMFISEIGDLWLSRIQQFWESKRTIRITGGDITSDVETMMSQGYQLDSQTQIRFAYIDKDDVDGDFDIDVFAGSTMYSNKSALLQMLIQMGQTMAEDGLPLVDRKTILEHAELDNVEDIMKRFEDSKVQQQQSQQQQIESNMQSQQQAQQLQMEIEQLKAQVKLQDTQLKGQNAKETQMLRNQSDKEKMTMQDMMSKEDIDNQHTNDIQKMMLQNQNQEQNQNNAEIGQNIQNGLQLSKGNEEVKGLDELAKMPMDELTQYLNEHPELVEQILGSEGEN